MSEHFGPRPAGCCGTCPPIEGGGYDCTCKDNPRCPVTAADRPSVPRIGDTTHSADQLDALPEFAMVRDHMGGMHVKYGLYGGGYAWQEVGFDTAEARSSADMFEEVGGSFPVLYVPADRPSVTDNARADVIEQAARVIREHIFGDMDVDDEPTDCCVRALADAGLLATAPTDTTKGTP